MNQKNRSRATTSSTPFIGLQLKGQKQVQEPTQVTPEAQINALFEAEKNKRLRRLQQDMKP